MKTKVMRISLDKSKNVRLVDIPRFEKIFELTYLPHLIFENKETEHFIRKRCAKADHKGKIETLARWLGTYHGKHLDESKIPDITLRWIHAQIGYGIFANRPFKKWQFIGEYAGVLRQRNLFFYNVNDYCFMYPRPFKIQFKAFTIDSEKKGNLTRFINHSDRPNAESICVFYKGIFRVVIRASRAIAQDEEITYDYGEYYWKRRIKLTEESSLVKEGQWLTSSTSSRSDP